MQPARRNLDVYFLCLIVEEEKITIKYFVMFQLVK